MLSNFRFLSVQLGYSYRWQCRTLEETPERLLGSNARVAVAKLHSQLRWEKEQNMTSAQVSIATSPALKDGEEKQ